MVENLSQEQLELVATAVDSLVEFQLAQVAKGKGQSSRSSAVGRNVCRWQKPAPNSVKANWDAALKEKEGKMGMGVIIRDEEGEVLASLCGSRKWVSKPDTAEMQALWRALKLCAELNFVNVVFEGDAFGIVKAVNGREENWEWNGQIIEDIREILKNRPNWVVQHTYRECNNAAHSLARYSLNVNDESVWIESVPEEIVKTIIQDKLCSI
ncbi:uncharacterized protein LOC122306539 [Carya illinoinensis]|uniref:uncharacterized protein LOC122306539 n=1 Tax=Carya illinoinensis TaxID=32201 RepID=UPI001C7223DF|nr:uncharacterized protein LOC122306539 [Carya illinoinensis]